MTASRMPPPKVDDVGQPTSLSLNVFYVYLPSANYGDDWHHAPNTAKKAVFLPLIKLRIAPIFCGSVNEDPTSKTK